MRAAATIVVVFLLWGLPGVLSGGPLKGKKPPIKVWIADLLACADANDGKCVLGLTDALKKYSKEACPELAAGLGSKDRRAALVVESMVTLQCPQTLKTALDYVEQSDSETRMEVFEAACLLRDAGVLPFAEKVLDGNRAFEKERVCFALGRSKLPEAQPLLMKALSDGMFSVRQHCSAALGNYKGKAVTEALCKAATSDTNAGVRVQATLALKQVGDWNTIPCLTKALGDRDPDVHFAAHEALVAIAGMDLGTKPPAWDDWWKNGAKKPQ